MSNDNKREENLKEFLDRVFNTINDEMKKQEINSKVSDDVIKKIEEVSLTYNDIVKEQVDNMNKVSSFFEFTEKPNNGNYLTMIQYVLFIQIFREAQDMLNFLAKFKEIVDAKLIISIAREHNMSLPLFLGYLITNDMKRMEERDK